MKIFLNISLGFLLLLLFPQKAFTQSPDHYYLELKSIDTTFNFGKVIESNEDYNNVATDSLDVDQFVSDIVQSYTANYKEKPGLFIYIHGMNAHYHRYQRLFNKTMSPEFYERDDFNSKVILSLVWHAGFDYDRNVKNAINSGQRFAPVLDSLYSLLLEVNPKLELDILCHSMGNRCFQGIYTALDSLESSLQFDDVVFAAADLPVDIFCEGQALTDIADRCQNAYITRHNRDMTLGASKFVNEADRLGLGGPMNIEDKDYLQVLDCSLLRDNETLYFNFENHKYHYSSPTGREALFQLMVGDSLELQYQSLDSLQNWRILEEIK